MSNFQGKTFLISGGSRGIGKAIGLKLAAQGANIVIAAKSVVEHPKLPGTIYTAAEEIRAAGGQALAVPCDLRHEEQIISAVAAAVEHFGGIDGLVNNASAISLTDTLSTKAKRYDLMMDINVRGTFLLTKHCAGHLKKSTNAHILTLSPPLNLQAKWWAPHAAYTLSKMNMTLLAMAWAEEFRSAGIASNALWPVTTIATAAVQNLLGGMELMRRSRKPEIVADAAFEIFRKDARGFTGHALLDEEVLRTAGQSDFSNYSFEPGRSLQKDLFLD